MVVDEIFKRRDIILCVSDELMREYQEVLRREKFTKYFDFSLRSENLLIEIERKGVFFHPKITLNVIGDLPDNRLLEVAVESNADFLLPAIAMTSHFQITAKPKLLILKNIGNCINSFLNILTRRVLEAKFPSILVRS